LSLLLSAQLLGSEGDPAEYSFIFLFSAISQLVSLWFISQIPDVRTGDVAARSAEPVPWKQMLNYTPFRNLLLFNLAFAIATGGLGVFAVEFLREAFLLGPDKVMLLSSVGYVAAMILLPVFGPICDKIGSRPMLLVGTLALSFCSLGYFSFACFHLPNLLWLVGAINFLWGATGSNFNVAMVRASMLVIPEMGRNHFFALYTVLSSLAFGVSPIFWGLALDFAGSHLSSIGVPIHRHTFFFVAASICTLLCLPLLPKISEKLPQKKDNIIR
ncbi:MAG: MFS transporter, partial [Chthoniobacterales bacterium]|nr:MFS transporter [Chthoniobacterales bacterium]